MEYTKKTISPRRKNNDLIDQKAQKQWSNHNTNNQAHWPDNDNNNNDEQINLGELLNNKGKITAYMIDQHMIVDVWYDIEKPNSSVK